MFSKLLRRKTYDLPVQRKQNPARDKIVAFGVDWLMEKQIVEEKIKNDFGCEDLIVEKEPREEINGFFSVNENLQSYEYTYISKDGKPLGKYEGFSVKSIVARYISNNHGTTNFLYRVDYYFENPFLRNYERLKELLKKKYGNGQEKGNQIRFSDSNHNKLILSYSASTPVKDLVPNSDLVIPALFYMDCSCEEISSLVYHEGIAYSQRIKAEKNKPE